jgi:hypothetical protein
MLGCLAALPAFADVPARVDVQPPTEVRSGNYLNFIVAVYDAEGYRVDFPVSENLIVVEDNSGKTTSFVPEARRESLRGERDHHLIDPGQGSLAFLDQPRLERTVPVTRHLDLDRTRISEHLLRSGPVPRVRTPLPPG